MHGDIHDMAPVSRRLGCEKLRKSSLPYWKTNTARPKAMASIHSRQTTALSGATRDQNDAAMAAKTTAIMSATVNGRRANVMFATSIRAGAEP